MKKALYSTALLALVAMLNAHAADNPASSKPAKTPPPEVVYDAASAFEFLKTLSGDWEMSGGHDHGGGSNAVNFRTTAAGSSVIQTIFAGEPHEMITVFHRDGDTLLLTHYCALQNAPVMKFEKTDKPGELKFVFHGGTNFDPKVDAHVHEGVFQIKDANTLEMNFVSYSNGQPDEMPASTLKRKEK